MFNRRRRFYDVRPALNVSTTTENSAVDVKGTERARAREREHTNIMITFGTASITTSHELQLPIVYTSHKRAKTNATSLKRAAVLPVTLATYRSRFNFERLRRTEDGRSITIEFVMYTFVIVIEKRSVVGIVK